MKITLPDGTVREFESGTTGMEIAKSISEGLARNSVGIMVNGEKYDLGRPIHEDAEVRILTFDDEEGKDIFWHSSAHLMAEAIQDLYPGVKFGIGPSIENGFYYDVDLPGDRVISSEDLPAIEKKMTELARKKSEYKRQEIEWDEAIKYYKEIGDEYKVELLEDLKGQPITFYKHGRFTDLCRGAHLPDTGMIKAIKLMTVAGAYWRGDSDRPMMTRIYGVTFPKKKMLDEYLDMLEEAKKRDHRKLGKELGLFIVSQLVGGGLPLWLPKGAIIRRKLEEFLRKAQIERGYDEVVTPHIGNLNLYKTSGHYPYYSDSQYPPFGIDEEEYILKPMNCPHHHVIYNSQPRSYRDLPLRMFEFGTVYRYEQSGELSGLTRVRGFTQDDAHIYCTPDQLKDEIKDAVLLNKYVFDTFGMELKARLSFRDEDDEKFSGNAEKWDEAENTLIQAADELGLDYHIEKGEAAFYGPKIDFVVRDAIGRKWQLGTVQVDYVMPGRFGMEFTGADNQPHEPVIIHRAPAGSMERFISILIEHYAGNFPFWIAPVQVSILPIGERQHDKAREIYGELKRNGFRAEIDLRSERINRKIAESEQMKIPFALIIGQKEVESGQISVRRHMEGDQGTKSIDELINLFEELNVPGAEK
ncbi:MAG: threonine--tRNA ligase [Candidatus Kapaibacterium sp.]